MTIQVLVIDDTPGAAKTFASLIAAETGLESFGTSDPEAALEITMKNDVKVVVLDQVLDQISPPTTGTQVFRRIVTCEPGIRGIMFSGRAKEADFVEGMRLKLEYLDKNEIDRLPELVRTQYQSRLTDIAQERLSSGEILTSYKKKISFKRSRVLFEILGVDDIPSESDLITGEWRVVSRINRGAKDKYHIENAITHEVIIEEEELSKISATTGLGFHLVAELRTSLETSLRTKYSSKFATTRTESFEQELYLDSGDPQNDRVRARSYEAAQLYRRRRALIRISCDCCGSRQIMSIPIRSWTGQVETRQVDFLEGEAPKVIATGITDLR